MRRMDWKEMASEVRRSAFVEAKDEKTTSNHDREDMDSEIVKG